MVQNGAILFTIYGAMEQQIYNRYGRLLRSFATVGRYVFYDKCMQGHFIAISDRIM